MTDHHDFAPGDHLTARCDACGVEVIESLVGRYDRAVADAAMGRLVAWIEAHYAQFHLDASTALNRAHVECHAASDQERRDA